MLSHVLSREQLKDSSKGASNDVRLAIIQCQPLPPANLVGPPLEFTPYPISIAKPSFLSLPAPTKVIRHQLQHT